MLFLLNNRYYSHKSHFARFIAHVVCRQMNVQISFFHSHKSHFVRFIAHAVCRQMNVQISFFHSHKSHFVRFIAHAVCRQANAYAFAWLVTTPIFPLQHQLILQILLHHLLPFQLAFFCSFQHQLILIHT